MSHARLQPALVRSLFRSGGCLDLITIPHIFFFGFLNGRERTKFKIPWIFMRKEPNYRGRDEIWMQSVCKHTRKHVCTFFSLRHSSVALQCALRKLFFSRIFRWPCSWDRIFILSIQELYFVFPTLRNSFWRAFFVSLSPAVEFELLYIIIN